MDETTHIRNVESITAIEIYEEETRDIVAVTVRLRHGEEHRIYIYGINGVALGIPDPRRVDIES